MTSSDLKYFVEEKRQEPYFFTRSNYEVFR